MKDYTAKKATIESLLNRQQFRPEELDYNILEKKKLLLQELATTGNSAISIFDMYRKEHVFYSSNYSALFGYDADTLAGAGTHFIEEKIHPDDVEALADNGISLLKLFFNFSTEERASCKFINEYRILKADQTYVRVIEQDQILTFDPHGNMWLSLGIIDIAPNQTINEGLKSQVVNFKTGDIIAFPKELNGKRPEAGLTPRETEVLKMIKGGLLSKEISGKLAISVHTVNTHRQRILEKLNANNSMEAVSLATSLGIL
jgi:DNA-binding CsgD family transcriptional regulator